MKAKEMIDILKQDPEAEMFHLSNNVLVKLRNIEKVRMVSEDQYYYYESDMAPKTAKTTFIIKVPRLFEVEENNEKHR